MRVFRLGGTAFLSLLLLSANAVANAEDQEWSSTLQTSLAVHEYHASENHYGLQAPNRSHNLRTYFDVTGIQIHDRTDPASRTLAGLSLVGIGRGDTLQRVAAGEVTHDRARVEIRRPGVIEWYENSFKGLEQGFTLEQQPQGAGALVLELAVEHARAILHGDSIALLTNAGRKLEYGGLVARDATGRVLASHLETPSPRRVRLVVDDTSASYPVIIDPLIVGVPDAMLESNQLGSSGIKPSAFGSSVAGAGDVNGDGIADVVVGAWGWDGGENEEGAAFVFLGSLGGGIVGTDPGSAFAVIESNQAGARLGWSVSGAGDVNGDGLDDIVVGAYLYSSTAFFEGWGDLAVRGAAFVYLGGAQGMQGAGDPSLANARIFSNELDSFLGYSVSGAGDVNGDGFADIVVGGPRAGIPFPANIPPNDRQGNGGVVLVFLGSASGITGTGFADAHKELRPYPPGLPQLLGGGMGGSVSGAGDVNGDTFADIIVGMTGSGGSAIVFQGSAAGIVGDDPGTAHAMIVSDATTPLGDSVSGAGDVNGDGFDDIILGAPRYPTPPLGFSPSLEGAILIFLGSPAGITATGPAGAQAMFQGTMAVHELGWDVAAAGDVDGDGFDDVIAAALGYAGGLDQEGAAYVFRGGPTGIVGTSLRDDAYVRLESKQSRAAMNTVDTALSASGIGDVNGDGFADVMLGTGFYDAGEENEGAAFVYHGGPAPAIPNRPPVAVPGDNQSLLDLDNDGSEVITINGGTSFDPDGSIIAYAWLEGETLLGTNPALTTAFATAGQHTLVLTVTDDGGITRGDPVNVSVGLVDTPLVSFDHFDSGDFAGGVGWAGGWAILGDVSLSNDVPFPDPPQARIGAGATLSRAATLPAGTTGMMVTFNAKASLFSPSDEVAVQVSRDVGAFTTVKTFTFGESDDAYHFYGGTVGDGRVSLSWYPATATNLALRYASTTATGILTVDNIEIRALVAPLGEPLPSTIKPPSANAGADIVVNDNDADGFETVFLDGSSSADMDGFIASWEWFEVTSGGTFPIGNGGNPGISFARGSHSVQLIVTDNDGASASDTVTVTVNQPLGNNQPPVANAGLDKTIVDSDGDTLEFVHFDGRASADPDGTVVAYNWTENGNTINSAATFTITMPIGVHTVDLTVTDNQGATSTPDTVVITVVAAPPPPPPPAESLTITRFEFRADKGEWRIDGTSTIPGPGNAMTLYAGPTVSGSPLLGTAAVGNTGLWSFRQQNSSNSSGMISIQSSQGNTWEGISGVGPVDGGDPPPPPPPPPPGPPTVDSFIATPGTITVGASATLSWTTTDADSVTINGVIGQPADGSMSVSPTATTTYDLTATGPGGTANASVTVTVNSTPPPPPLGSISLTGPTSVDRGQLASFTVVLTNTGSTPLSNVQLTLAVSPSQRIKNISPAGTQNVGNVLPGAIVSRTWTGRADKEGGATVSAEALSDGTSIDTATQSLTVVK